VIVGSTRRAFPVTVRSRHPSELRAQTEPPPWRYRLERLWIAFAALAALLVAAAGWLARPRRVDARTPLERALDAVRAARGRPAPERRRAVGALAGELRRLERPEAARTDRLAWARPEPERTQLDELVEAVEP
jgi:HAMP domain-containing protein